MVEVTTVIKELVDIRTSIPQIICDIRYATPNNFTREILYEEPLCFIHKDLIVPLKNIQQQLAANGHRLKIFDAYRPPEVQLKLWKILPDERYVSNPAIGSRHTSGTAVDVTIVDAHGVELHMPTAFDVFTEQAHAHYPNLAPNVLANRDYLQQVMTENGFQIFATEWWHFDFVGFEKYPQLKYGFEDLG